MITHHRNPCQATLPIAATGIPHLLPAKPLTEQQRGVALASKGSDNPSPGSTTFLEVHQITLHFRPLRPFCHVRQCLQPTNMLRILLWDFSACSTQAEVVNIHLIYLIEGEEISLWSLKRCCWIYRKSTATAFSFMVDGLILITGIPSHSVHISLINYSLTLQIIDDSVW